MPNRQLAKKINPNWKSRTKRIVTSIVGMAALAAGFPRIATAGSASPSSFVKVSGDFRLYDFTKDYSAPSKPDQRSSAAGGVVDLATKPFWGGFGLGLGLYGSWALESSPAGDKAHETTLTGAGPSIRTIGQAFVQYARDGALFRVGRQLVETPWIGARDSRMVPQSFEGVWGQVSPARGWTLMALRLTRFKSRTSDGFYQDNLYYPGTYGGDQMFGTKKVFPKNARLPGANGTVGGGVRYASKAAYADLWYYNFYDFARTAYFDGGYTFGGPRQTWRPYVDGQFMKQSGGDYLARYGAKLFGVGGAVDSTLWGVRAGLKAKGNNLSLSYDKLEDHAGSFGGGALVSPYGNDSAMFAAVMANDLFRYGPGEVVELADVRTLLHNRIKLKVTVLRFRTTFGGNPTVLYVDPTYLFGGALKGLSLRDRLAWSNRASSSDGRALVYNRVMLQYKF